LLHRGAGAGGDALAIGVSRMLFGMFFNVQERCSGPQAMLKRLK
jgi:hypothetical protein